MNDQIIWIVGRNTDILMGAQTSCMWFWILIPKLLFKICQ